MVQEAPRRKIMTQLHTACRSCGEPVLQPVLSLGKMPLANALLAPRQLLESEPAYPLDLAFCPRCTLVQITETVPPEQLFSEYFYFSSYSETMLRQSRELAERLIKSCVLDSTKLVVELGSNDGYQLQYFVSRGIPVLGIDPARNVTEIANAKGVRTLCEFFGKRLADELRERGISADIMIAKNVLAHVADLNGFVEGIRVLLNEHGAAVIEVPYVRDLIDRRAFDTIYHEHLCYFSLTALNELFKKHGMVLTDVERIPIHGGSLRVYAAHEGHDQPRECVRSLLVDEAEWGLNRAQRYLAFAQEVRKIRVSLRSLLKSLKDEGNRIAAYGAAAKGAVLLNYCGIGNDILEFVVDLSPHKQGHYMPGVHLGIYPPSRLLEDMPNYTLLLAWNFADEIIEQQSEYVRGGGRFIVPIPEPKIVNSWGE